MENINSDCTQQAIIPTFDFYKYNYLDKKTKPLVYRETYELYAFR